MIKNFYINLKRPFIWLMRFRKRCGYGVHSPFAFNLITWVIYEKTPFYHYATLQNDVQRQKSQNDKEWNDATLKVNKLLFRLVNHTQPQTIVSIGKSTSTDLYLKAAKTNAVFIQKELCDEIPSLVDFLYIHCSGNAQESYLVFDKMINVLPSSGICVIKDIHRSSAMKKCWKKMMADDRVGITFDLYDVGILFFDKSKIKQHYIVNF